MPPKKDLTGRVFGDLSVVEEAGKNKHGQYMWLCKCSCGTTKAISGASLIKGTSKSCGGSAHKRANLKLGSVYGQLTVIDSAGLGKSGDVLWKCVCSCGNYCITTYSHLNSGHTKSCGCRKYVDISEGQTFSRLTTIKFAGVGDHGHYLWLCLCSCGNTTTVTASELAKGGTRSCGCLAKEVSLANMLELHKNQKGKNSPKYNPKLTDEERQIRRNYPEYWEWRAEVYKRDNYTCQCCGQVSGAINAHHLEDYANNPELRTDVSNGITLCERCHKEFHKIYGQANQTYTWQFLEFINTQAEAAA